MDSRHYFLNTDTTYRMAVEAAKNLYGPYTGDEPIRSDPDELYLSGIVDMLTMLYDVSTDEVLSDIQAEKEQSSA